MIWRTAGCFWKEWLTRAFRWTNSTWEASSLYMPDNSRLQTMVILSQESNLPEARKLSLQWSNQMFTCTQERSWTLFTKTVSLFLSSRCLGSVQLLLASSSATRLLVRNLHSCRVMYALVLSLLLTVLLVNGISWLDPLMQHRLRCKLQAHSELLMELTE